MIINIIRLLLVILLIVIILIDIEIPEILTLQMNQLVIAILIIFIIVVVDEIIGFLLGVIFLITYFKYYQKIINKNNNNQNNNQINDGKIKAYTPFNMDNYNYLNNIDNFKGDLKPNKNSKTENINEGYISINDDTNCITMPYISTELLEKAQNNIYDENNYYNDIKKNENNINGIQGINKDDIQYMAYDKKIIENNYN